MTIYKTVWISHCVIHFSVATWAFCPYWFNVMSLFVTKFSMSFASSKSLKMKQSASRQRNFLNSIIDVLTKQSVLDSWVPCTYRSCGRHWECSASSEGLCELWVLNTNSHFFFADGIIEPSNRLTTKASSSSSFADIRVGQSFLQDFHLYTNISIRDYINVKKMLFNL